MRLIPRTQEAKPEVSSSTDLRATAEQVYYQRGFLALIGVVAALSLLGWGYVVMPRNGLGFWLWLGVALAAIAGAVYLFWKQVSATKKKLEKSGAGLAGPKFRLPLGLVLILALGLIANLIVVFANPQPLNHDAWGYSDQGYSIAHQGYRADAIRTPGYPLFIAVVYKLVGDEKPQRDPYYGLIDPANRDMVALWIAQALLLSLTALLVYGLSNELFSKERTGRAGKVYWGEPMPLLAAGLVAFCAFLWGYTGTPQTEICSAFWLTVVVYSWFRALRARNFALYFLLCGLALAWLMQTRPTFVYLPGLALATFALFGSGRWRLYGPGLALIPLALMLIPPTAANIRDWQEPTPLIAGDLSTYQTTLGTLNVIRGGMPRYQTIPTPADARFPDQERERLKDYVPLQQDPDKAKRHAESDYWKRYFSNYVTSYPLEYAATMLKRVWYQWSQHFVFPYYDPAYWDYRLITDNLNRLYLIFALVGFGIVVFRREYRLPALPLYLSILYLMGLNLLVQDEFRYTLPAYPLMLILAAFGIWKTVLEVRSQKSEVRNEISQGEGKILSGKGRGAGQVAGKRRSYGVLIGLGAAVLLVGALSVTLPLIPDTTAAQEKALDAMYASQQQQEGCYFSSAKAALDRALALDGQEKQVREWEAQFPQKVENAISDADKRIAANPSKNYESFRCRGDAYREQGRTQEARADFQQYLKYAPPDARDRNRVEGWLKELG